MYEGPEGAGVGEMRTSRSDGDDATGRGVRAEAGVSTESSRGMWLTRAEKCVTEDVDTRASVVSPRRPQCRFLMGEARSGNWRGALHCTERESRAHWPGCPWLLAAGGEGARGVGCWLQGGGGTRGWPEASAFSLLWDTVTCWGGAKERGHAKVPFRKWDRAHTREGLRMLGSAGFPHGIRGPTFQRDSSVQRPDSPGEVQPDPTVPRVRKDISASPGLCVQLLLSG